MTIEDIQTVVTESGKEAQRHADAAQLPITSPEHAVNLRSAAAEWMQVKMLAEIARQLAVMNRGNGAVDNNG